ncbi:MAG TPA: pantoate--beta-alanine ligase [Thermodesulfobacteriota bacterium]|nr:pantoate--beta-alanine ligase [Thermodesulfobacteriota bacterium]
MQTVNSVKEMQSLANGLRKAGKSISLVPTMGALHKGHLSLIAEGRKKSDILVVSIFVNPTQFGPNEDLNKYPKDLEGDLKKIQDLGVDVVFAPALEEIYPDGFQTYVEVQELQKPLCGRFRPGHFRGVATVVLKLFNIVKPDTALFGEKDYQQLKIVERMVRDLNIEIEIVGIPIVRDNNGLALSSRNQYLSEEDKKSAYAISKAIKGIKGQFHGGMRDPKSMIQSGKEILEDAGISYIDYLEICDPETLRRKEVADSGDLVAVAVRLDGTRLIDNIRL